MTDQDLAKALSDLTKSVTDHRYELGREMATLNANVGSLQDSHAANADKLDEVLRLELSCPARAGWESLGREIGETKKKISENKISVESELRLMRGEASGLQDIGASSVGVPQRRSTDNRGNLIRAIAWKALPYILFGGVALGAYLTSGGDTEATVRALRAVTDAVARVDSKIVKVEKKVDEVAADSDQEPMEAEPAVSPPIFPVPAPIE